MYVCISIYFCNDLNLFLLMIDKERGDENQMNRCLYLYMYYFVFACLSMHIYNISLVSFVCANLAFMMRHIFLMIKLSISYINKYKIML